MSVAARAFQRHYRQVYRFVRRRSSSDAQAEDVTQEVFADAAAALERFKPGSTPVLAWLYTVAQRRVILLKLLEGRTFAEIAERLGTTEAAAKMRLARGLERLRDELEREGLAP